MVTGVWVTCCIAIDNQNHCCPDIWRLLFSSRLNLPTPLSCGSHDGVLSLKTIVINCLLDSWSLTVNTGESPSGKSNQLYQLGLCPVWFKRKWQDWLTMTLGMAGSRCSNDVRLHDFIFKLFSGGQKALEIQLHVFSGSSLDGNSNWHFLSIPS